LEPGAWILGGGVEKSTTPFIASIIISKIVDPFYPPIPLMSDEGPDAQTQLPNLNQ